jgi:iron complex outermembrane recepter protein
MTQEQRRLHRSGSPVLATAVSAVLATASGGAYAQTETQLGEVIVTATRRAERLQDVPESISAFDSNAIAMRGLQQIDDYAKLVPGMSLGVREPGATTIVFRGVAASGLSYGSVSSSALYLDEQPITQSGRNPDPRLIDIERLEALRGPQGTLYGASSQSGTLRAITNKPKTGEFESWVDAQVTQVDDGDAGYDISAMVNVPLQSDKLALRLVGFTARDAGYIDNVLSDSQGGTFNNSNVVEKDVNSSDTSGGRAALRWDVAANVDATFSAIFQDMSADGHGDVNLDAGDLNQVRFEEEGVDDRWYQFALTVNAELPFADAIFSASYFDRDFHYEADATDYEFSFNQNFIDVCGPSNPGDPPTPNCYYNIYDFNGDPRGFATNDEQTDITTFEARLQSKADSTSRWGWLAGAFYSKETGHTVFDSFIRGYEDTNAFQYFSDLEEAYYTYNPLAPTERWFFGLYDTELEQIAVFGELSFDVTDNFTLTAGGRWFEYERKFAQFSQSPEGFTGFTQLDGNQENTEDGTVVKLNATYKFTDDLMTYATYSEGFRVGGSNPLRESSVLPRDYESDELQNYEIGLKSEWLDNRVRLNVSAYYMKWKDFAVQLEDPQTALFQLGFVNLPTANIPGVEAEFAMHVNDQWQIDGAFSWNDAEVADATTITFTNGDTFVVEEGARLPITPDVTATLGIEFRPSMQLLDAQPFARFDVSHQGESVNSLEGIESVTTLNPVDTQDAYETGDLRFGLEGERWTASFFVDNVWDERAEIFFSNRWAEQRLSINRPRTYGLQFRYEF